MAIIIDGKKVADEIKQDLKEKVIKLKDEKGIIPGIALLRVGEDPASKLYVNMKIKNCQRLGFHSVNKILPENAKENDILSIINDWNNDDKIHGILVQLPLPNHINEFNVINKISPRKDVDGFHPNNVGRLVIGLPGFAPCTPAGIVKLIEYHQIETKGKHIVVIGRSNIVGKPIANLLYQKYNNTNGIVTIAHSQADDLKRYTSDADILITAVGVPDLIGADYVKNDVIAIDVGINRVQDDTKEKGCYLTGDINFDEVIEKAAAITPVPGGVGPMTITMLLQNTYFAAINKYKFD